MTASPASAAGRTSSGYFPNGVAYFVSLGFSGSSVIAHADTSSNYNSAILAIAMCSGTGVCPNPPNTIASTSNSNTYFIDTAGAQSAGHTYKVCFSPTFATTYTICTDLGTP
jgi:hypothetical protein